MRIGKFIVNLGCLITDGVLVTTGLDGAEIFFGNKNFSVGIYGNVVSFRVIDVDEFPDLSTAKIELTEEDIVPIRIVVFSNNGCTYRVDINTITHVINISEISHRDIYETEVSNG